MTAVEPERATEVLGWYDSGQAAGRAEGWAEGFTDGYAAGCEDREVGYHDGLAEGGRRVLLHLENVLGRDLLDALLTDALHEVGGPGFAAWADHRQLTTYTAPPGPEYRGGPVLWGDL